MCISIYLYRSIYIHQPNAPFLISFAARLCWPGPAEYCHLPVAQTRLYLSISVSFYLYPSIYIHKPNAHFPLSFAARLCRPWPAEYCRLPFAQAHLSIFLSIYLSIYPSISIYLSIYIYNLTRRFLFLSRRDFVDLGRPNIVVYPLHKLAYGIYMRLYPSIYIHI